MLDARALRPAAIVIAALLLAAGVASTLALDESTFADASFARTWERVDKPVEAGQVSRSWIWGSALTEGKQEQYADSPGNDRLVQYFDKARMEITHPDAVDDGLWYVTTGLLVNELISGQMQIGDTIFLTRSPAAINFAGDPGHDDAPTYADLAPVLTTSPRADGSLITERMDGDGHLTDDPTLATYAVTSAQRVQAVDIDHQIASVFWDFMNSSGPTWQNDEFVSGPLFPNPFYATGFPVTEAYWSSIAVNGIEQDVLWQCFQRRCLTYTPGNPQGWQVEFGNVGKHYYEWRYGQEPGTPTATETPTVTPTVQPTATTTPVPVTDQLYVAYLSGANEVSNGSADASGAKPLAVNTQGSATAWFHVSADGSSVEYQIPVSKLENITEAHIHLGGPDENGPVVVTLFDGNGAAVTPPKLLAEGQFTASDLSGPLEGEPLSALLSALASGDAYINIHTSQYPSGEVRGQIGVGDEILLRADLSGANEPETVDSDASGVALLYYDASTLTLEYQLRVLDLPGATAAHIHLGDPGEDGPVAATLFTPGDEQPENNGVLAEGTIRASDLQGDLAGATLARLVYEIATGHTYVNVHTEDYPNGEIRGQPARWSGGNGTIAFAADLDGSNETSPVVSDATGAALFRWDPDGELRYELIVADTNDLTAAHIHVGTENADGEVVTTLYIGGEGQGERNGVLADGEIGTDQLGGTLAGRPVQRLVYLLATGNAYVNVHTVEHPDGEMRGQVNLVEGAYWVAHLDGINERPPVSTDSSAVALFEYRPRTETLHYAVIVSNLVDPQSAVLQILTSPDTGPIVAYLWAESAANPAIENGLLIEDSLDEASLVGPLTGSDLATLVEQIPDGEVFANILTEANPLGEARGTLE